MDQLKKITVKLKKNPAVESILQFGSSLERKRFRDIDICIMAKKKLSLRQKLALHRGIPEKYDLCFYDDLPINIKQEVLSKGKILYTADYYKLLRELQFIDLEYPRFRAFLEDYHAARMASVKAKRAKRSSFK